MPGTSGTAAHGALFDRRTRRAVTAVLCAGLLLTAVPGGTSQAAGTPLQSPETGELTLIMRLVQGYGGAATPGDWALQADGPVTVSSAGAGGEPATAEVEAGAYALSESGGPTDYAPSFWECATVEEVVPVEDAVVEIAAGEEVTCSITINEEPPEAGTPERGR